MRIRVGETNQTGFTLIEIIVGMAILGVLMTAIGSALIVAFRTTDATNQRLSESNDVQISSAFLANDVQSAKTVAVSGSGANCSVDYATLPTTLVSFTYAGGQTATYACGVVQVGNAQETQVTRSFAGGSVVIAHFAGTSPPVITCTPSCGATSVDSVKMAFSETDGYAYTLLGTRRSYASPGVGVGSSPPPITMLSTGAGSPLWVQGSCPDPGTSSACYIDPTYTALPISDVTTAAWTPAPLWNKLNDGLDTTFVTNAPGDKSQAKVALSSVNPPDTGVNPIVELRAGPAVGSGNRRITLNLYDGGTLLATTTTGNINKLGNYDWTVTSAISAAAYGHLTLGFAMATGGSTDSLSVYGVSVDTASPSGLLTVKGPLYVNSPLSGAVRLTGTKSATKIAITNGGDFKILNPGACAGCSHTTVACAACAWNGNQPWTSYPTSLPDPLRSLAAPDPATLGVGSCGGSVCQPGVYASTLSRTANTTLNPGIYYLKNGISITGSASLSCTSPCTGGVMLYIAGGSVTFAGSSSVNLTAPSSGIYQSILMFQARADTNEVKFAGNSGSGTTNALNGIVYVPNSTQVTLATGSASLTAKAIVAQNIKVSSPVTIG